MCSHLHRLQVLLHGNIFIDKTRPRKLSVAFKLFQDSIAPCSLLEILGETVLLSVVFIVNFIVLL
jgi:hypothetical protein